MSNTHPNTPFGKWFYKHKIWRPSFEDAIVEMYDELTDVEKALIKEASGFVAIVNANLDAAPDEVFAIAQKVYPDLTRQYIKGKLNDLNRMFLKIDANTPDEFEDALAKLQSYLKGLGTGHTWEVFTRGVVVILSSIFLRGQTPTQKIETVLEYIYVTFIRDKVVPAAA